MESGPGFGIRRRRRVLGPGRARWRRRLCQALRSLQPGPASQQGRPGLRKRLTSTNSHHLCRVGKPHVLPRLLFMRRAGWLFSVVQSVGTRCQRRNPSCRGTADHEKEGPSGRRGKQNSRPPPHPPQM
uniref:Uncharacterized protein n=1 Tax=Rangifer tarandus platyrhynchus TaxID=3082113 RepID=A0ACB0E189_RANTA|nr:unnamed protein product [Rangifer tarandus platyrhynchus]